MADFYACSFMEFRDMGLEDAADQVLKEGLAAYPAHGELLSLAKMRGIACDSQQAEKPSGGIEGLLAGMMKSQQPSVKVSGLVCDTLDLEAYKCQEPEMSSVDFWKQLETRDLRSILLEHGGLIRVSDFLPSERAEEALATLKALQQPVWAESTSAAYKEGEFAEGARHSFFRYDGDALDKVIALLRAMAPDDFPSFQAAMYRKGGNLAAHDDSNYFVVDKADKNQTERFPAGSLLFRKVAVIYYLTKEWQEDFGGALMDLHQDRFFYPRFNSMVAFLVPRLHQVQELMPGSPSRFSIFGWFSDEKQYPSAEELAKMPCFSTLGSTS